ISVFLKIAKSQLAIPWLRASDRLRPTLPKVKAGGWLKFSVLNQRWSRSCARSSSVAVWPLLLGREPPPKEVVRLLAVLSAKGNPLWKVEAPLKPQPETSAPAAPLTPPRTFFPFPTG